jgi:sodium/pantothenate symporter
LGFNPIAPALVFGLIAFLVGNKIGEKRHSKCGENDR